MSEAVVNEIVSNIIGNIRRPEDKIKISSQSALMLESLSKLLAQAGDNRKELLAVLKLKSERGEISVVDEKGNFDLSKIEKLVATENERITENKKRNLTSNAEGVTQEQNSNDTKKFEEMTFEEKIDWFNNTLGIDTSDFTQQEKEALINVQQIYNEYERKQNELLAKYNNDPTNPKFIKESAELDKAFQTKYPTLRDKFALIRDSNGQIMINSDGKLETFVHNQQGKMKIYQAQLKIYINKAELTVDEQNEFDRLKNGINEIAESIGMSQYQLKKFLKQHELDGIQAEKEVIDRTHITGTVLGTHAEVDTRENDEVIMGFSLQDFGIEYDESPLTTQDGDELRAQVGDVPLVFDETVLKAAELAGDQSVAETQFGEFQIIGGEDKRIPKDQGFTSTPIEGFPGQEDAASKELQAADALAEKTALAVYKPRFTDRVKGFFKDTRDMGIINAFNKNFISNDPNTFTVPASSKTQEQQALRPNGTPEAPNVAQEENIRKQSLLTRTASAIKRALGVDDKTAEKGAEKLVVAEGGHEEAIIGNIFTDGPDPDLMAKTAAVGREAAQCGGKDTSVQILSAPGKDEDYIQ